MALTLKKAGYQRTWAALAWATATSSLRRYILPHYFYCVLDKESRILNDEESPMLDEILTMPQHVTTMTLYMV